MPPRTMKRGGAAAAAKRNAKAQNTQQKEQQLHEGDPVVEQPVKVEDKIIVVEDEDEVKADVRSVEEAKSVVEEKPALEEKPILGDNLAMESDVDRKSNVNGSIQIKKEDDVKDSVDEYERDERLDLEDNDHEYEPEEFGGVDYDDKEIGQEDVLEAEEVEGEPDDIVGEDGDMVEEEVEEINEELEIGEDDEHISMEHEHEADHDNNHLEHTGFVDGEEEEHHDVVKERRKRKEFEVFVGGLDKDVTEDNLRNVFSAVGEVSEIRLMMNPQTKKNKGFAFLRFATVEQAKRAVTELRNPMINGKRCGVSPSQDSDTLFLGNVCKTWTKEYLKEKLKHYRVDNVEDIILVEDGNHEGMNRGFAFLEFSSRSDAMDAFKRLQKRDVVFGVDRPAKVSFADSFIDPGGEIMSQVKTVFIDGLSPSWDEDHLKGFLKKYGEIEKIELARNMPSAKRRDFGFVTFGSHDAAMTCAKSINNAELGEGDSKAKVRARLSRPLQRGRGGKHVGRGDYHLTRAIGRSVSRSWTRPSSYSLPSHQVRNFPARVPAASLRKNVGVRDRRPMMSLTARSRPLPPPPRAYDRRPTVPSYPKSSMKRDYGQHEELPPPRGRAAADYGYRVVPERHPSYRESYSDRDPVYSDLPRSASRPGPRRGYVDDGDGQRFQRQPLPPPAPYRDRGRNYDTMSGSKRPYSAIDDVPPRYADPNARQSRARLDYDYGSSSQFSDAYSDRFSRSNLGYSSSRSSMSGQGSHDMYVSRQGMGYGGPYGGSNVGMYSSSYGSDYMPRRSDVGGDSYSSMYSGRSMNNSSYMGSGSGSYY